MMFGLGKRKEADKLKRATEEAIREVGWIKDVAEKKGVAGLLFWTDSYLCGFAQGIVAVIVGGVGGADLKGLDQTRVLVAAIGSTGFEDAMLIPSLMEKLTEDKDENFLRGSRNGMTVMMLQRGVFPPKAYDADIKQAIADAGNVQQWAAEAGKPEAASNLNAAAALALRQIYLGPHLENHFTRHLRRD